MGNSPTVLISFAAGILSFLSPCVLPLIPSYISFIGGVSFNELKDQNISRGRIFFRTLFFVAGFALVFIVLGIVFSGSALLFSNASRFINLAAGIVVIALGLNVIFDFWKFLNFEKKFHHQNSPSGYIGSFLVGTAFGAGWSPCVGPILAGILFLAGQSGRIGEAALLLSIYSLGLGLPFIIASLFFNSFIDQINKLKKHLTTIRVISGIFLTAIGVLIAFGRLQGINRSLITWGYKIQMWAEADAKAAAVLFGIIFIFMAVLPFIFSLLRGKNLLKPAKIVWGALLGIFSILQFLYLIDTAGLLVRWLTFQGL
jgi:cytochrome c-type biogenesis protein